MFKCLHSVAIAIKISKMMYELPQCITSPFLDREIVGLRMWQRCSVNWRAELPHSSRCPVVSRESKMYPKCVNPKVAGSNGTVGSPLNSVASSWLVFWIFRPSSHFSARQAAENVDLSLNSFSPMIASVKIGLQTASACVDFPPCNITVVSVKCPFSWGSYENPAVQKKRNQIVANGIFNISLGLKALNIQLLLKASRKFNFLHKT